MLSNLKTGNNILGLPEFELNGCRFLYKKGIEKTIITFSAFPPKDIAQKYNYIKDFLSSNYTFLAFLDTKYPEDDARGTYYITNELDNGYLQTIHCIIQLLSNTNQEDTYLLCSSKGGVGALLLGLTYNYPNIIINAPQAKLADYIKTRSKTILSYMLGTSKRFQDINYDYINDFLLSKIKTCDSSLKWNIHITCGKDDSYHLNELEILKNEFNIKAITIKTKLISGGHDNEAIAHYREYFKTIIQNI